MARAARGESWLSHPHHAQTLDDHLADGCDYGRLFYLPLKRLNSHSKKPGCFGSVFGVKHTHEISKKLDKVT
jgi:hypothetical protein